MSDITTAWMLGCVTGFFMGATVAASQRRPTCRELMRDPARQPTFAELLLPPPRDRDPDWRRSFNHENTSAPTGEPPLRFQRSIRLEPDWLTSNPPPPPGPPPPPPPGPPQPHGGRLNGQRRTSNPPRVIREDFLP